MEVLILVDNIATDYLCVRVSLVDVKKRFIFGFTDRELGKIVAIPDTMEETLLLYRKIWKLMKKYGVEV